MNRFVQLHLLTSYPPSNLNRDDLGRPKTAIMGGANRLRVSSQSLKRAWREAWKNPAGLSHQLDKETEIGIRSLRFGLDWIEPELRKQGLDEQDAEQWSRDIQLIFGEAEDENNERNVRLKNKQLAFVAPVEEAALMELVGQCASYAVNDQDTPDKLFSKVEKARPESDKKKREKRIRSLLAPHVLGLNNTVADIALFGRMLASSPAYNTEAAAQVAHAITVHQVEVEDDFFTAVDDLNTGEEDVGAGHMGETEFAAGLFYLYVCIDRELLRQNLSGNDALTKRTLAALIEAAATISPTGKQNSFASRARASYILCECGDTQPRSLSVAFLKPVKHDMLEKAIAALEKTRDNMDKGYGDHAERSATMNVHSGKGELQEIINCATAD